MLGLKNLAMLPSYFGYIFVHLRQKARLRPELSPKFLSTLGANTVRTHPKSPGRLTTLARLCSIRAAFLYPIFLHIFIFISFYIFFILYSVKRAFRFIY